MARLTTRICCAANCHEIGTDVAGGWRCERHRTDGWSRYRASPAGQARAGYGAGWKRVRDLRLRRYPTCEICGLEPAVSVHHLRHEKPGDPTFLSLDAVRSTCDRCHRQLSHGSKRVPRS